jgi:ribosomal protein S18 acetylase RimI-like enzyme
VIVFKEVLNDEAVLVVERLARKIWTEHFSPIIGMPQVEYMLKEWQSALAIKRCLVQGYKYYLIDLDGVSVGYLGVLARPDKGELFLSKFYLLSECRGRGIGRQMMDFVKEFARGNGLKKIALNTNKKNLDTIRFYEKAGFCDRSSDVIDLGHGFVADDWRMEMVI